MTVSSEPRARWRDLAPRLASALVMAPLGLAAVWAGGLIWQGVLTLLALVTVLEWASLCGARPKTWLAQGAAASLIVALACHVALQTLPNAGFLKQLPAGFAAAAAPFVIVLLAAIAIVPASRTVALGVAYVGAGWASLLVMREGRGGLGLVFFIMAVVWANDIGAYLAGRMIGGPKLAPAWSPGKTWAGAAGGFVVALAAGMAVAASVEPPHPGWLDAALEAAILSVWAQAGDLLESAMKRHYGKKDSGSLIPGHGGLLDRVDGLLAASCAAMLLRLAAIALLGAGSWQ